MFNITMKFLMKKTVPLSQLFELFLPVSDLFPSLSSIHLYLGAGSGPKFETGFRSRFWPEFRPGWTDPGPKCGPASGPILKPDSGTGKNHSSDR